MGEIKKRILSIELVIFLLFAIRLIGITNPPLETSHSWRQCTGLMVARNFYEVDNSIFYPRIDDTAEGTGIIEMEFPLLYYIHYLISSIFGYSHWYGRLINLIVSSFGLLFFAKTVRRLKFSEQMVFASTIIFGVSIWFSFSRKTMSDTFCISFMFIGLYYALHFLLTSKWRYLFFYLFFATIGILSKIPAGIYLIVLLPFIRFAYPDDTIKTIIVKRRQSIILLLSTAIPLILTYAWYFLWNAHLMELSGTWYNIGIPFGDGFIAVVSHLHETLRHFYFDAFQGYAIFAVFLLGLLFAFLKKNRALIAIFLSVFGMYLLYIFKSGPFFYEQNYYIIPFVPAMALVAGYGVSIIPKQWIRVCIIAFTITECVVNQQHDFFIKDSQTYKLTLENVMDSVSTPQDKIAINGNGNHQLIYFSHRKGWNSTNQQLADANYVQNIASRGCSYLVIDKHTFPAYPKYKKIIFDNKDFVVAKIE